MNNLEPTALPDDPRVVPDRLKLPLSFDTKLLAEDLANLGSKWTPHYVPENYAGDWSVIPLRSPRGETHPNRVIQSDPTQKTFADTTELQISPYFRKVLSSFPSTILATRLMRLASGSVIKEHTDDGLRFEEGLARIHIPILTNPDVEFYLNGSRVVLIAGSCWYLRLSDPHRVANRGKTDRVHLVIDLKVNGWLTKLFRSELSVQRKDKAAAIATTNADRWPRSEFGQVSDRSTAEGGVVAGHRRRLQDHAEPGSTPDVTSCLRRSMQHRLLSVRRAEWRMSSDQTRSAGAATNTTASPRMAREYRYRKHLRWGQYAVPVFFGLLAAAPWVLHLFNLRIDSGEAEEGFVFAPILSLLLLVGGCSNWCCDL